LINKEVGYYGYDLDLSRTVGDTARLAANLRQAGIVGLDQLAAIALAIKEDFRVVRSDILPRLEELGWVEIIRQDGKIVGVNESIPPLEDIL
jgi:hypothetical protein